jgi:dynein heavy chain
LVDDADNKWLIEQLRKTIRVHLEEDMDLLFKDLLDDVDVLTEVQLRNLIYCDFEDPYAEVKLYREVKDWDKLAAAVHEYLAEYNDISRTTMDLVLFRYAVHRR